ncbi:MAG: ferredoxin [Romboutsia sp.]|nr:ferredoxin [Romboutsia sp.]
MKAKVNKDACIGCGACQMIAPEVFEINDDGVSEVIMNEVDEDQKDEVKSAVESCPTGAISTEEE